MKLLHIDASILGENSGSCAASCEIVTRWQSSVPRLEAEHPDLAALAAIPAVKAS